MESEVQSVGENPATEDVSKALVDIEQSWRGKGTDWFLQKLASWANQNGMEFGLTLHTPTGIVSGTLISHVTYFKAFAEEFAGPWLGEDEGPLRDAIATYGDPLPGDDEPGASINFIHLKEAQFYAPGKNPMPENGILWRGKISAVCSFHLGRFSAA